MTLYPHQREGAGVLRFLATMHNGRAILGDETGTGKTYTLIETLAGFGDGINVAVICPAVVRTHWRTVLAECGFGGQSAVYSYEEATAGKVAAEHNALVLDEFHYLGNPVSKRTRAILGVNGIARRMQYVLAASGTPMPRNPRQLWPLMSALFPRVVAQAGFRNGRQWREAFCIETPARWMGRHRIEAKVVGVKNVDQLRDILDSVMLRRTHKDIDLAMPELQWQVLPLDGPGAEVGDGVPDMMAAHAEGWAEWRHAVGKVKAGLFVKYIVPELRETGEKVVIFAYHRAVLNALREAMSAAGIGHVLVDGLVSAAERDRRIGLFQEQPDVQVFLAQNAAVQTGVTLTASSRVYLLEPDPTPAPNRQMAARVVRIGQPEATCQAVIVTLAGTVDDHILRQYARETRMVDAVID